MICGALLGRSMDRLWLLSLVSSWILFGGRFGGRSRLLVSWILFGVRGRGFRLALLSMIQAVAWSLALALALSLCGRSLMIAGPCFGLALDDSGHGLCSRFGVDSPAGNRAAVALSFVERTANRTKEPPAKENPMSKQ